MTDKEKVLAKWPDAECMFRPFWNWFEIEARGSGVLGIGKYETAAWADAARRLEGGK